MIQQYNSTVNIVYTQNFYQDVKFIYLVRIWTYKNADKKTLTFSRRSKHVKKTNKNGRKTDMRKITFMQQKHTATEKSNKLAARSLHSQFVVYLHEACALMRYEIDCMT